MQLRRHSVYSACLLALAQAGCAVPPRDMGNAIDRVTRAAEIAHESERQVKAAQLLGLIYRFSQDRSDNAIPATVCIQSQQSETVASDLGSYADAINLVSKTAAKPEDTSYSGYAAQFRKNQALVAEPRPDPVAQDKAQRELFKNAENTCRELLSSDLNDGKLVAPLLPAGAAPGILGVAATAAAIDQLIKGGLGVVEGLQRQIAVRHVMENALDTMDATLAQLSQSVDAANDHEIYLAYSAPDSEAAKRSRSRLGMVLSMQRWILAQRLRAEWRQLAACNDAICATDWKNWQVVDSFLTDRDKYLALAASDPNATLKALKESIENARKQKNGSIPSILDALSALSNSISDIDDKYQNYLKSRK